MNATTEQDTLLIGQQVKVTWTAATVSGSSRPAPPVWLSLCDNTSRLPYWFKGERVELGDLPEIAFQFTGDKPAGLIGGRYTIMDADGRVWAMGRWEQR